MEELAALFGDEVVVHLTKDMTGIVEDGNLDKSASLVGHEHLESLEMTATKSGDNPEMQAQQSELSKA